LHRCLKISQGGVRHRLRIAKFGDRTQAKCTHAIDGMCGAIGWVAPTGPGRVVTKAKISVDTLAAMRLTTSVTAIVPDVALRR